MTDINRINELISEKRFNDAKELIIPALQEEPNNLELLKLAGLTSVNLEEWKDAKAYFESVIKYNPNDATALFYLANCYDKTNDLISAKNNYIKVIELRKEYVEAYKSLCVILMKLNQPEEALKYATIANTLSEDDYIFDFVIGTAYMKIRDFSKSIEPFERALQKEPENLGILNSLGTAYMATSQGDKAIKYYKKALEISPESPMAYFNLGSAFQIQQNHEEACKYLKEAVKLDEEDESFKIAYAMSLVKSEKYEEAANIYKALIIQHPDKENYKYNLVTCLEALGEITAAIDMLEKMVFVNQKFILPAQKLASLYIKTNNLSKAKDIYDNILLKNNPTAETLHQYAVLSSSLCDTDTAERILKKVIKMNPNIAKAHRFST